MKELRTYLSMITRITSKIRLQQYENGLSYDEVNNYLIATVTRHFHLEVQQSRDFRQILSVFLATNVQNFGNVLMEIIQILQVELANLQALPPSPDDVVFSCPSPDRQERQPKKYSFYISTEDNPEANDGSFDTPKKKVQKAKNYFGDPSPLSDDLDEIQQSIRQTLERTKRLRTYLKLSGREEAEKMSRQDYQGWVPTRHLNK